MVLLEDKKYACEACIKGHRSSSCKHIDRPLFEIKKKGRPITQCEHCRELRKTKQVHVKCLCESKDGTSEKSPKSGKKGYAKVAASAAFPHGLPEAQGASVALHTPSDASSSDSDGGGLSADAPCDCKDGGDCHCYTARRSHPKQGGQSIFNIRVKHTPIETPPRARSNSSTFAASGSTLRDLRPVLPRPPQQTDPLDLPPNTTHPHIVRSTHGTTYYSPYTRAYEGHLYAFDGGYQADEPDKPELDSDMAFFDNALPLTAPMPQGLSQNFTLWPDQNESFTDFRASCGCGHSCACPGCFQHRGGAWTTGDCANPSVCNSCFTSSIPAPSAPTPPTTPLGEYVPASSESLEQWIRGISSMNSPVSVFHPPNSSRDASSYVSDDNTLPNLESSQLPGPFSLEVASGCCGGRCRCPPGRCTCLDDCCGCCQGCHCEDLAHDAQPVSETALAMYAVSGERTSCCKGRCSHRGSARVGVTPWDFSGTLDRFNETNIMSPSVQPRTSQSFPGDMSAAVLSRQRVILPKPSSTSPITSVLPAVETFYSFPSYTRSTASVTSGASGGPNPAFSIGGTHAMVGEQYDTQSNPQTVQMQVGSVFPPMF